MKLYDLPGYVREIKRMYNVPQKELRKAWNAIKDADMSIWESRARSLVDGASDEIQFQKDRFREDVLLYYPCDEKWGFELFCQHLAHFGKRKLVDEKRGLKNE